MANEGTRVTANGDGGRSRRILVRGNAQVFVAVGLVAFSILGITVLVTDVIFETRGRPPSGGARRHRVGAVADLASAIHPRRRTGERGLTLSP